MDVTCADVFLKQVCKCATLSHRSSLLSKYIKSSLAMLKRLLGPKGLLGCFGIYTLKSCGSTKDDNQALGTIYIKKLYRLVL